jgi:hypothetical protein
MASYSNEVLIAVQPNYVVENYTRNSPLIFRGTFYSNQLLGSFQFLGRLGSTGEFVFDTK